MVHLGGVAAVAAAADVRGREVGVEEGAVHAAKGGGVPAWKVGWHWIRNTEFISLIDHEMQVTEIQKRYSMFVKP